MRNACKLILVIALGAMNLAAGPTTQFGVAATKEGAVYRRGETVTFRITNSAHQAVQYKLTKDGRDDLGSGQTGLGEVTASLNEPGVIQCEIIQGPRSAMGGAAVEPEAITPSMPAPADFDEFWERQKERLASEAAKPVVTSVKSPDGAVECFDVQVNCPGGAPLSGYLARPREARGKSLPAILYMHSAGVDDSSLTRAVKGAKMGLLAFDFNAHGLPNGKGKAFYDEQAGGKLKGYPAIGSDDRDKIYFLGMYLRVLRALEFVTSQPQWDGKTLIVQGSSQGGGQALVAAGMDRRVTLCLASVPALCDHTAFMVNRTPGWPRIVPKDSSGKYNDKVAQAARYIDGVNFAARIKCPTWITVGFIDRTCSASSVYAAYNNIPAGTEKHIIARPAMGHSFPPDLAAKFDEVIKAHVSGTR